MNTIKNVPKSSASISRKRVLDINAEDGASPPLKVTKFVRAISLSVPILLFSLREIGDDLHCRALPTYFFDGFEYDVNASDSTTELIPNNQANRIFMTRNMPLTKSGNVNFDVKQKRELGFFRKCFSSDGRNEKMKRVDGY